MTQWRQVYLSHMSRPTIHRLWVQIGRVRPSFKELWTRRMTWTGASFEARKSATETQKHGEWFHPRWPVWLSTRAQQTDWYHVAQNCCVWIVFHSFALEAWVNALINVRSSDRSAGWTVEPFLCIERVWTGTAENLEHVCTHACDTHIMKDNREGCAYEREQRTRSSELTNARTDEWAWVCVCVCLRVPTNMRW